MDFCNLRHANKIFVVEVIIQIFGVILIILQKGITDTVTVILVLQYTEETGWIWSFNESYININRSLLSAQRFLKLETIP